LLTPRRLRSLHVSDARFALFNIKRDIPLRERLETLSPREREIMVQVTAGRLNKQIAHDIGIAESTVKVHRTNLMRKMKARSLPELSRMADILQLRPQDSRRS
jgi:FixJ family two-component response regulator